MPDQGLLTIEPDNNDTIWCGSFNGRLLCFNGSNFSSIDMSNSPLLDNYILDIEAGSDSNIWIATKKNLVTSGSDFDFRNVLNKQVSAILMDRQDALWIAFATGDTSLLVINANNSMVYDSLNSPFNNKKISIRRIVADFMNNIWIITGNKGLFKFDGISFINYNTENCNIPSDEIFDLEFDEENVLWVGTASGLAKLDDGIWTVWDRSNSEIPTNVVNSLKIDSENKLWFSCADETRIIGGEYGGGLVCFDGQNMVSYNMSNSGIKSNTILDILIDENELVWLGTYGAGLMCFDKLNKWTSFDVSNSGIASNWVGIVRKDNGGSFWIGHIYAGISVFNPDSILLPVDKHSDNLVQFIYPNPVRDRIHISLNSKTIKKIDIMIYDLNGSLIWSIRSQNINSESAQFVIDLGQKLHNNRIYILKLKCDNTKEYSASFLFEN